VGLNPGITGRPGFIPTAAPGMHPAVDKRRKSSGGSPVSSIARDVAGDDPLRDSEDKSGSAGLSPSLRSGAAGLSRC